MPTKRKAFSEFDNPSTLGPVVDLKDILSGSVADIQNDYWGTGNAVPNKFPTIHNLSYRLAIIGEAPGEAEEFRGIPFCPTPTPTNYKAGASGRLLNEKLSHANIIRDACFVGNICQVRPPNNDITIFSNDGPEITSGLQQLSSDLKEFRPNVCLLLGKTALRSALGSSDIGNWRGSVFTSNIEGPFLGRKCIATYHPAACLRQWEWTPLLFFDLRRALEEASSPYFIPPERIYNVPVDFNNLIRKLEWILAYKPSLAYDIEGYYHNLKCISFSWTKNEAIVVPFVKMDGSSYWDNEGDELLLWQYILNILAAPDIPKTLQNGLYDRWCLQYGYDVLTYGSTDDIMLKFAEAYCELKKSLAFQNSILTKEPYYKEERGSEDMSTFLTYACKDSATTYECNERLNKLLLPSQQQHYRFNHSLLTSLLYMELKGIRYDTEKAKAKLADVEASINSLQGTLDEVTGCACYSELAAIQSTICYKRDPTRPKSGYESDYSRIKQIFSNNNTLSISDKGYIGAVCKTGMNIKSVAWKTYLYETLKLPKQFKVNEETGEKRLTADYESLLKLTKVSNHPSLNLAIQIGLLRTRSQMLAISADNDGRVRCGYNCVGTETGRLTCYTSPTGSGYNLQTIPSDDNLKPEFHPLRKGMRDLFMADEGYYMFQCDLSGADGWSIGAYLTMLGDSTMLDDLRFGIKPAQRVCYLLRHGNTSLQGKTRHDIKELLKEISKESWDYFGCKQGIWGTAYTMGPRKLATVLLTASEGALDWDEKRVKAFQDTVKTTYRIKLWHDWAQRELRKKPELVAPNGFKRRFYGRDPLGEYLAHIPQVMTTYATNMAMYKLWNDPENRDGNNLIIQPLHQVHDALIGQFPKDRLEWAKSRIKTYFDNPVVLAGTKITIPFSGEFGNSWGDLNEGKI